MSSSKSSNDEINGIGTICPHCGMPLPKEARFCAGCGRALAAQVQHTPAAEPAPPPSAPQQQSAAGGRPDATQHKRKKKSPAWLILLPLLALLIGAGSGLRDSGGFARLFEKAPEALPPGIEVLTPDPAKLPSFQPVDGSDFSVTSGGGAGSDFTGAGHEAGSSAGMGAYASTGQWYPFPHASFAYMQIEEDDSYVYSIRPRNASSWQGDLIVLDKASHEVTAIQLLEAMPEAMIYSFTLADEYLYFGVVTDAYATFCAYYRASKYGGEAEFLFVEEAAFMTSYQGYVLLMFSGQGSLGVYSFDENRLSTLPLLEGDEANDWLYSGFSVYEDMLYYGQHGEAGSKFCSRPFYPEMPNIGARTVLVKSPDTVTDVVYDFDRNQYACTAYNFDDYQYELRFGKIGRVSYQAPLQFYIEDFPFAARHGDSVYVQSDGQLIEYFLDGTDTGAHTYHYPLEFSPIGICREFLFFPGEVRLLTDGSIIQQGEPPPGGSIILEHFDVLREIEAQGYINQ